MGVPILLDMRPHRVESAFDVELLRQIRNACIGTFVHHNEPIAPEEQKAWWARNAEHRAWLYFDADTHPMGFGLLTWRTGVWWTTVAVLPNYRRRGAGKAIMRHLATQALGPVYGESLKSNIAGVKLHDPAEWERLYEDERIVRFRARWR